MSGKLGAISILLIILVSSMTLPASAQTPILDPQITVDCTNWQENGNLGPISWSLGKGYADCVITNDDSRKVRIEVTWSAEHMDVSAIDYGYNDVSNGQELELESNEEFGILFALFPEKMEPGEAPFEVQIVVTETEELNGWRECQNCEVHEFETEFDIGPWGYIKRGKLISSNIPGFSSGLTLDADSRSDLSDELICSEELLSHQSLSFSLELESSKGGRETMYGKFFFSLTLVNYDNIQDKILIEESAEVEFDANGEAISNATLNLNVSSDRIGDWYVKVKLSAFSFLESYPDISPNSILDRTVFIDSECLLDPSMVDPDTINPTKNDPDDLTAISMFSTFIVVGVAAIYVSYQRESLIQ